MQIKDYITKNFPSLNWNILPQIFAENGVEMNEEIEAYLRNTPENTNWSILEQLGGSGNNKIIWEATVTTRGVAPGVTAYDFTSDEVNLLLNTLMPDSSYLIIVNDYNINGVWSKQINPNNIKYDFSFDNHDVLDSIGITTNSSGTSIIVASIGFMGTDGSTYHVIIKEL